MSVNHASKEELKAVCRALNKVFSYTVKSNDPERTFTALEWLGPVRDANIYPISWNGSYFVVNCTESNYDPAKVKDELFINVMKYGMYYHGRDIVCNICGKHFGNMQDMINHLMCEHMESILPDVEHQDIQ
jgi:hypothetical protein